MRFKVLLLVLLACAVAGAKTLTVRNVVEFIHSSAQQKFSDKDIADYLATVTLSERLTDRAIEEMQAAGGVGPRTLHALWALRDKSKALPEPSAAAPAVRAETPPPSSEEQGRIIDDVREYALNYSKDLPDFICTEEVKRAGAPRPPQGNDPQWRDQDTLLIKLSYFEQKEQYKLLMLNNSITTKSYEAVGGAKSFGDFGSLMRGIFEPATQARFEWSGWSHVPGREAMVFSYSVEQPNSRYEIKYDNGRRVVPAYSGHVWIDNKSHKILRVSLRAENIPVDFPIKSALTTLDYDTVDLSGHQFLLPSQSIVTSAAEDGLSKNVTTFHNYQKYSADTTIEFK